MYVPLAVLEWKLLGGGYLKEVVKIFNIYIIILVANFTIILGDMLPFCFLLILQNY